MANIVVINIYSDRVCAVRLTINYVDILLINVYMPCEGSEASTDEFTTQLSVIDDIISIEELGTSRAFSTMKIGRNVKDTKDCVVSLGTPQRFSKMAALCQTH